MIEALEKSQLKNLEEFRFLFDSEAEIGVWIARLNLGDQEQLQVARLRRTWSAVKLFSISMLSKIGPKFRPLTSRLCWETPS